VSLTRVRRSLAAPMAAPRPRAEAAGTAVTAQRTGPPPYKVARPSGLASALARAGVQSKPAVGRADDPAEHEADELAGKAVAGDAAVPGQGAARTVPAAARAAWVLPASSGRALDPATRGAMEQSFGADFTGVHVHTGAAAAHAAKSLSAHAFTIGSDIAFGAGRYLPGTSSGMSLIAHELAHVIQQRGTAPATIRRQSGNTGGGFGGGGAGGSWDDIPSKPAVTGGAPIGAGLPNPYAVELKGRPLFSPPVDLAASIRARAGGSMMVHVKFGAVADGYIPIYYGNPAVPAGLPVLDLPPSGYQTPPPPPNFPAWGIPLIHPAFPAVPDAIPMLWIRVHDSVVSGAMGWLTAANLAGDPRLFKAQVPIEQLFGGLGDFDDLKMTGEITNSLWNGRFVYAAQGLTFRSGAFTGGGRLRAVDEGYELDAGLDVPVAGLPADARIPVAKSTTTFFDTINATKTWKFSRAIGGPSGGLLTGRITGNLGRGSIDVRGTVGYANKNPKISGTVTIVIGSFEHAKEAVRDHLGTDAPATIEPATPGDKIAVTGWGQLDFAVTDWLTGNAEVIVHPEGWVTARGELLPTVVIGLFRQRQKDVELGSYDPPSTPITGIPGVAAVQVDASAKLSAYGWIGPGALHDLRVTGLLSNHPAIVNRFDVGGTMSAPAVAGLRLEASIGIAGKFLHFVEVVSARIHGTGELELQVYAEAAALIGRRASSADPAAAEYFLKGKLEAAAELLLRLELGLSGRIALWKPKLELADRSWSLGSGAVQANFEYVLGHQDRSSFSVDFGKIDFDAARFAEAVARAETLQSKGYGGKAPVDATTTSTVAPGPHAPVLQGPPPGGSAPAPGGPGALDKRLDESFTMLGEPHALHLSLLGRPDLTMESPAPKSLLRRITGLRRHLRNLPANTVGRKEQLADLDTIEAQTKQVLDAAEKVAKGSPYLTPSVPGFKALKHLIEGYAKRHNVTDLEVALGKVSVDPTKPATVLNKFPTLAADGRAVATVSRIIVNGVATETLRKIVDNHQPRHSEAVFDLLLNLDLMMAHNVIGWEKVIGDMAIGGNLLRGATWVLRYINDFGSWTDLTLEINNPDAVNPGARRWDALMSGTLYEFKWWYSWSSKSTGTFLAQIINDYRDSRVGKDMSLRWVFGPSPLTRAQILQEMNKALDGVKDDLAAGRKPRVNGYTPKIVDFIKSRLDDIVRKVTS
jgi:hypothetical protein